MMMKHTFTGSMKTLVGLFLGYQLFAIGSAQAPVEYPAFDVTTSPEYRSSLEMASSGRASEAIAALKDLASRNPHTTLGAVSLFKAASISSQIDDKRALYEQISRDYPQSRFDILARTSMINLETATFPRDNNRRLQLQDSMVQQFGGPTLSSVLSDDIRATQQTKVLPVEIQKGIDRVYVEAGATLEQLNRVDDALNLAFFQRETFTFDTNTSSRITYLLALKKFGTWKPYQPQPAKNPDLGFLRPNQGQTTGPRPKIRWETTSGDWRSPQVDLSRLSVLLDGQDVTRLVETRVRVKASMSTKPDAFYEKIRYRFRPQSKLASGVHNLTVSVVTAGYTGSGPGKSTSTLSFVVKRPNDDVEDERPDEQEAHLDIN